MSDLEIVKDFLVESYENLDRLDRELISLEKDPGDSEILASVFRTIHTIKGTAGFLNFHPLEAVTHVGESLLARIRDGVQALNPAVTTALLAMVDAVREMLASIETTGDEGNRNDQELIATLTRLQAPTELNPVPEPASPVTRKPQAEEASHPTANLGDILVERGLAKASDVHDAVRQQKAGDTRRVGEILVDQGTVNPQDVLEALSVQQRARGQSASDSTIRVDVDQLDRLMNRVGELVLLRNQILQFTNVCEDNALAATSQRLNLLTTELQEGVMKTRMQPIGNLWSKFPRTVRDAAAGWGKQVRIEMEGKETELDRTILEAIKDPLTHIVRNSVDHGIESPEKRIAAGKNPQGLVRLRAYHEGGQVHIEVTDDGAGLDYDKIRAKAIQKGMIHADQAARLSERELASLVFLPGFSTAEKVTNVSGRGVGMDVVKTNIEKISGTVDLQSKPGAGSTVRMKIPLTLAIIPALIVTCAGERYAIPQVSLLELVRLEGEKARAGIEWVQDAPVHRLRGRLLPLVDVKREFNLEESATSPEGRDGVINIVVLQAEDRQFGVLVDDINDTEEIVVKPLAKQLKNVNVYAGATIMGDGRVALILDVLGLAQHAHVIGEAHERQLKDFGKAPSVVAISYACKPMLLFESGEQKRMAVELEKVARLEEFPAHAIEIADGHEAVQYRGEILPLLRIFHSFETKSALVRHADPLVHVIVYAGAEGSVGLVVDRILDIVEEPFVLRGQAGQRGVLGSAIIQNKITEVLDIPGLIAAAPGSPMTL